MVMEDEKLRSSIPGADATVVVGTPGETPAGKIYSKTGEHLSDDEYARRIERDEAVMGYDKQIEMLKAAAEQIHIETPEERQKRERREKSKRIIAAIGDGLSAAANLYFTSQYAPNAYNPRESQVDKVNERIEALKAEREADKERYNNFMLRIGDAENAKARTLREMQAQQEAQKLAREKAQRDAEVHNWNALLQVDKQREQKGKADKSEQEAIAAQYDSENKPQELELKNATETARAESYRASAANSMASARAHDRSNDKEFKAWDKKGREYKFRTKEAAERFAKQQGTWKEEDDVKITDTSRRDHKNRTSTSSSTVTTKGGYPEPPKPEDNTPPSRRGNNDNTPPSRRK